MTEHFSLQVQHIFLIYLEKFIENSVLTLNETHSEKLKKKINLNEAADALKRFDLKVDLLYNEWNKKQKKIDRKMDSKESKIQEIKAEMELLAAANDETIRKAL